MRDKKLDTRDKKRETRNEKQETRDKRQDSRLVNWKNIDFSIPFYCTRNDKRNVIAFANERQSFEVNVKRKAV